MEDNNSFHNPNNQISSVATDRQPTSEPGNEENAPENSFEERKRNLPRFRVFKKMRLGLSPYKGSRRGGIASGEEATKSKNSPNSSKKKVCDSTTKTRKKNVVVDLSKRMLQLDPAATDNPAMMIPAPPPAPVFVNDQSNKSHSGGGVSSSSVIPTLENIRSNETGTETSSSGSSSNNSRNWLNDFGKQNKGNTSGMAVESRQQPPQGHIQVPSSSMHQVNVPQKDPRFHYKRKVDPQPHPQPHHDTMMMASENANPGQSALLFPSDPMANDDRTMTASQVFLAPVIVPPSSIINSRGTRRSSRTQQELTEPPSLLSSSPSPQKRPTPTEQRSLLSLLPSPENRPTQQEPKELSSILSWPSPQKRPSGMEPATTHAAIVAAQDVAPDAPDLAASSSQETSSSESESNNNSVPAPSGMTHTSTTSSMACALVKRLVDPASAMKDTTKARLHRQATRSTPIRIKPRVKAQEVQATDKGYASVAKLSAWLADDPTSTKKVRHVRRGANVISKSRKFEKDLEDVIVEENNISSGAVKEKTDWLKSAFVHHDEEGGEDDEDDFLVHHQNPNRHMMMMRTRPVNDDDCARSEFVVKDDSASSISVSNKKKWLENAFKKEDGSGGSNAATQKRSFSLKAQSDIGPVRESRDEVSSRAKKMWQQKSERRATGGVPAPPSYRSNHLPPTAARDGTASRTTLEERMRQSLGSSSSRASAPPTTMATAASAVAAAEEHNHASRHSVVGVPVEEDTTPVDFRAARQLLIQRSQENGNDVTIASKVQRRANKFERINKDTIRRKSITGLLKPTWESNLEACSETDEAQGPSDAYTKSFVEDIAPKKSIDELP